MRAKKEEKKGASEITNFSMQHEIHAQRSLMSVNLFAARFILLFFFLHFRFKEDFLFIVKYVTYYIEIMVLPTNVLAYLSYVSCNLITNYF